MGWARGIPGTHEAFRQRGLVLQLVHASSAWQELYSAPHAGRQQATVRRCIIVSSNCAHLVAAASQPAACPLTGWL